MSEPDGLFVAGQIYPCALPYGHEGACRRGDGYAPHIEIGSMTTPVPADDGLRAVLAAAMPGHRHWCDIADADNPDDCDCGITDALNRLMASVREWGEHRAAGTL